MKYYWAWDFKYIVLHDVEQFINFCQFQIQQLHIVYVTSATY